MSSLNLSTYQSAIIDFVQKGNGNGCCNAVAGSGKSTTLRLAALALKECGYSESDIKVIVFGKANAEELIEKFGSEWKDSISTLHSAGFSLVRQYLSRLGVNCTKPSADKYKWIAGKELGYVDFYFKRKLESEGSLKLGKVIGDDQAFLKVLDFLRLTNKEATAENIEEIADHFEIDKINDYIAVAQAAKKCLEFGEKRAKNKGSVDFTDMVYLPIRWGLKPGIDFKSYRFVLVDECQDLNSTQLELALKLTGNDGRLLFVGDPFQAIMGFAGADNNSYYNIVNRVNATELPLSICYRCPQSHIELVKAKFPNIPIQARDNAPIGKIANITEKELFTTLVDGDMVLSRKTSPLVSLCIKLIARGIAATVKGKAIGEQIKNDLEDISKIKGFDFEEFPYFCNQYKDAKLERLRKKENSEQLVTALNDKIECLLTIYESQPNANSIKELGEYIDTLFSDDKSPITLSTAHRSKGLENDRIFILNPKDMPLTWRDQSEWQLEQEMNLLYVALTRSKNELYFITDSNEPFTMPPAASTAAKPKQEIAAIPTPPAIENKPAIVAVDPMIEAFGKKIKPLLSDLDREDMFKLADYIQSLAAAMSE